MRRDNGPWCGNGGAGVGMTGPGAKMAWCIKPPNRKCCIGNAARAAGRLRDGAAGRTLQRHCNGVGAVVAAALAMLLHSS